MALFTITELLCQKFRKKKKKKLFCHITPTHTSEIWALLKNSGSFHGMREKTCLLGTSYFLLQKLVCMGVLFFFKKIINTCTGICHLALLNLHKNAESNTWVGYIRSLSHGTTKLTKWPLRPAKTQINLVIHPVWSESSQSTWRNLGSFTYPLSAQWRLRYPGWSESLLGTHVILLVLSCSSYGR